MKQGKVWKFGDNIDTDIIIAARYLNTSDEKELAKHIMEDADPKFSSKIAKGDIIVAGGRGMGSKENFDKLYELADAIGGVVGATRPLVEKGWIELPYQVGQTGKTVSPKLYLAFGISGAIQHVSGISGADTIVAINNDPNAEIFQHANYGIVGDCMEVLNDMLAHLK